MAEGLYLSAGADAWKRSNELDRPGHRSADSDCTAFMPEPLEERVPLQPATGIAKGSTPECFQTTAASAGRRTAPDSGYRKKLRTVPDADEQNLYGEWCGEEEVNWRGIAYNLLKYLVGGTGLEPVASAL